MASDLWVRLSLTNSVRHLVEELTEMTLADGDTKSMLTDNAKRAIQGNVTMHVTHPGNLVVKFRTNASSAIWWQNSQPMHNALSP